MKRTLISLLPMGILGVLIAGAIRSNVRADPAETEEEHIYFSPISMMSADPSIPTATATPTGLIPPTPTATATTIPQEGYPYNKAGFIGDCGWFQAVPVDYDKLTGFEVYDAMMALDPNSEWIAGSALEAYPAVDFYWLLLAVHDENAQVYWPEEKIVQLWVFNMTKEDFDPQNPLNSRVIYDFTKIEPNTVPILYTQILFKRDAENNPIELSFWVNCVP